MATLVGSKRRRTTREERKSRPARRTRRRKLGRWVYLTVVVVLVVLLWLTPWIVAHSPLLGWILAAATGKLDGTASLMQIKRSAARASKSRHCMVISTMGYGPVRQTPVPESVKRRLC